jgi:cytochrome P450 family 103
MPLTLNDLPQIDFTPNPERTAYQGLALLRAATPFVRGPLGIVMGLRHRHIEPLTGPKTRQIETETKLIQGISDGPIFDFTNWAMLFANGAVHQRRRAPIARTFAFKLMDAMRPKVTAIAEELVRERLGAGPFDFVGEFASMLPARIIADILGIPRSDLAVFMRWVQDTADSLGFIDDTRRAAIEQSLADFNLYVQGLLDDRRANPRGDFLSDYVAATAAQGDLSEGEIRTQIVGLILAGSDTTRGSMCMTLWRLLDHPAQWQTFCADPHGLKVGVVQEGLRFEPIVSAIPRVVTEEMVIDDVLLPPGCLATVSLLAALRDPDVYADPDIFSITRTDHPRWHPVFGAGAHRCAGEALARAEMEEALAVIARLAPQTRQAGPEPKLAPGAIRQIDQMRVAFAE